MDKQEAGKKQRSLRNERLKANRASETEEQKKERLRIRRENIEQEESKIYKKKRRRLFNFPPFYFVFETSNLLTYIQEIQGMSSLAL